MFYTSALRVPTEPQSWCRSPEGYRKHQLLLQQLVDYLDERGIRVELPVEVEGKHDNGVDLYVGEERIVVDLKSFWLTDSATSRTRTWSSPYHKGTSGKRATWKKKATEDKQKLGRAERNFSLQGGLEMAISRRARLRFLMKPEPLESCRRDESL